ARRRRRRALFRTRCPAAPAARAGRRTAVRTGRLRGRLRPRPRPCPRPGGPPGTRAGPRARSPRRRCGRLCRRRPPEQSGSVPPGPRRSGSVRCVVSVIGAVSFRIVEDGRGELDVDEGAGQWGLDDLAFPIAAVLNERETEGPVAAG